MNGITVPSQYKHQLRAERTRMSETQKIAMLRDFIDSKKGQAIRSEDFIAALDGLTTTPALVSKLVKKGRIRRRHVPNGTTGLNFHYEWVQGNVVPQHNPVTQQSEPVVISGRTEYATAYELKRLQAWFLNYMDKVEDGEALLQANKFRKFVMNGGELEKAPTEDQTNEE